MTPTAPRRVRELQPVLHLDGGTDRATDRPPGVPTVYTLDTPLARTPPGRGLTTYIPYPFPPHTPTSPGPYPVSPISGDSQDRHSNHRSLYFSSPLDGIRLVPRSLFSPGTHNLDTRVRSPSLPSPRTYTKVGPSPLRPPVGYYLPLHRTLRSEVVRPRWQGVPTFTPLEREWCVPTTDT